MCSLAGEYSKQRLGHCRSSIHSSSTPASNVEAKSNAHAGAELEVAGRWDPEQRRGVEHGLRGEGEARAAVDEDVAVRVAGHSVRAGRLSTLSVGAVVGFTAPRARALEVRASALGVCPCTHSVLRTCLGRP